MPAYSYIAFDIKGAKKRGHVSAQSEREARKLVKDLNLTPLEVRVTNTKIIKPARIIKKLKIVPIL